MRATKAYIASLGTTGLLLASAGSLLLVVSALFAFNAWPGADITDAVDSLVVRDDDSVRVSGPEQVALDAAPAALAVASVPGDGAAGPAPGGTADGTSGGGTRTPGDQPGGGIQGTEVTDTDGGSAPTGGGGGDPDDGIGTEEPTNQLADATEETTRNLGDSVGQVNPQLGDQVSDTGEDLSDIVRDLPDVQVGKDGVKTGEKKLLGQ